MIPISTKASGTCFAFPNVCLVPATPNPIPTPLPNVGLCIDAVDAVSEVLIESRAVIVETSSIPRSSGDEAGTGGGVMSGTFMGVVKFKTASRKVIACGKRVVLLGATTAHNGESPNAMGTQNSPSQGKVLAGG